MEQKDYLLREIEKIGVILKVILQKIFGGKGNLALSTQHLIENTKEQLLNEMNFNLDAFLDLNKNDSIEYLANFEGFSVENIELLADCLFEIGVSDKCDNSKNYLEKAQLLYDLCNSKSKTYSIKRETNMMAIKNILQFGK